MKKIMVVLASCLMAAMFFGTASAAEVKIGVVDLRKALIESETGKKAKTEFESFVRAKQSGWEEKERAIERLRGELEKQGSVLSKDARKAKEEELERVTRDAQRFMSDSQAELSKKENELRGAVLKDLRVVIDEIAKTENYTIVLEKADGLVLYRNTAIDFTDKVIQKYNASKGK